MNEVAPCAVRRQHELSIRLAERSTATGEQLAAIKQKGIGYHGALSLAPGEYNVRIVVRDSLSGRVGSVAAPLKVE